MTGIELYVHAGVFGACALFFLGAGGFYAKRVVLARIEPPEGKGTVPVAGLGLVDVAGVMIFLMFYAMGLVSKGAVGELSAFTMVVALILQVFMAGIVVALLVWRINLVTFWGLLWSRWWLAILAVPTVFVMWSFMAVLDQLGYNTWIAELVGRDTTQEMVAAIREETDVLTLFLMSVVAVIGAPVTEEIIFRGYIYPVAKRFSGIPCAVVFSGALFAVVHLNLGAILPLFILGMVLALLYEVTGSLWMPIAVHFVFNLGTVVMQQVLRMKPELLEKAGEAAWWWLR